MENASKALIIAASVLITVMLMSFMVFMFRRFKDIAKTTESRYSAQEIQAFNSKFINYETGGNHSLDDKIGVTHYRGNARDETTTSYYSYKNIFNDGTAVDDDYKNALISASQTLNKGYDVVTAINDAIDVNYRNNNSYKYNFLEIESSVEIIVDLGSYKNKFNFNPTRSRYLLVEPNKNVKAKHAYATASLPYPGDKITRANNFSTSNPVSVYDMLDELRNTKTIELNNKTYTVYKYYFFGEVFMNEKTGLVETVRFTLVKDYYF